MIDNNHVKGISVKPGYHIDAFPRGSNGSKRAINPETRKRAPEMKIGTEVVRFAYRATIGA